MTIAVTRLNLEANGPIEVEPLLAILGNHAIPGAERSDASGRRHTRLIATSRGTRAVSIEVSASGVTLEFDHAATSEATELTAIVRRWLDLDADTPRIARGFAADPLLGPLVAARPGLRVIGYPDEFEAVIMTILGQQVSVAAGRTFGGRLVSAYGTPGPRDLTAFPTPQRLVTASVGELQKAVGVTAARARTVREVAAVFADGLMLRRDGDAAVTRNTLLAIPGIGPWTVDSLAVRVLADPDAFPAGDLVLRRALGVGSAREAFLSAEAWRPWRAYALFHLWTVVSMGSP
jgi:3-methyladenine DNA glycosylase/8-oxoguanine DNA glycosylase